MKQAYETIGRAVFAAQLFETALIPIFELFKMVTEPGYQEKTGGYILAGKFKVPIKTIVNELSKENKIAFDLEERLVNYTENRHTLIHRWIQKNGWPVENDAVGFSPIIELAEQVELESRQLTRIFVDYFIKLADPAWAAENRKEYKERMELLFQRAHIDDKKT